MFKRKVKDDMLVEEYQYRAVITYIPNKKMYKASVQKRIGINEWRKVQCGLKGVLFEFRTHAEETAKQKIRIQKSLDDNISGPVSYIIYDD
jgi:hypothetical protein